ncbi:MAG: signal peptidase II [Actinomycetota bacterium]
MSRHRAAGPARRRAREGPVNTRLVALVFLLALFVVVIDQVTKVIATTALSETEPRPLIGDLITLQLVFNPGAAFSFASGMTWVFTVVAIVVVTVVIRLSRRIDSLWWAVLLGLLLGGATGNLIDRLFRQPGFGRGHVVDFLNYGGWFIGNLADVAIVVAAVGIAVLALVGLEVDGTRASEDSPTEQTTDG